MKSILDKDFKYTPSIRSDIREGFERVKKAAEKERERSEALIAAAEKQAQEIADEAARIVAKTRIKGKAA